MMSVVRFRRQEARHPEYATYTRRLASLEGWPKSLPVSAVELSDAGFFYWNFRDVVTCYFCGQSLNMWEEGDCAYKEHKKWFPWCDYIRMMYQDGLAVICATHNVEKESCGGPVKKEEEVLSSETKEARPDIDDPLVCKICYMNALCVVFMPCRHTVACTKCALNISTCAVCRHPIEELIPIYLQ